MTHRILQPEGWAKPRGYSNGLSARGRLVFVGGQIGWNARSVFESDDLVEQTAQTLRNVVAVLREGAAMPSHVTMMTWYIVDKREYMARLKDLGRVWREVMGAHYPAMAAVGVTALIEDRARIEIQAIAVVPD